MAKRKYTLKERAEQQAETRRRITEATVELHRTVGPARTTISEVAKRAGVQRLTVYNHFPDQASLLGACQAHWLQRHPPPDPAAWAGVEEPEARVRAALGEFYRRYRETEDMTANVMRDAETVPALRDLLEGTYWRGVAAVADDLAARFGRRGRARADVQAAVALALRFEAWRAFTGAGLGDDEAARLGARMVAAAAAPRR
jgi:AcrR family transcriptional regulator